MSGFGDGYDLDTTALSKLVGDEVFALIMNSAPEIVLYRVFRAADHYNKARRLSGIDDEMGAIRLIAAEEELVVAIFRWLEIHIDAFPDPGVFLRRYKDHRVKLAFYPTLRQFEFAMAHLRDGFTVDGLEDVVTWKVQTVVEDGKLMLRLLDSKNSPLITVDPLSLAVSRDDLSPDAVVDGLFQQFVDTVRDQHGSDLKTFIEDRATFRDRLLYAYDDVPMFSMAETLDELLVTFDLTLKSLLTVLTALLAGPPPGRDWGIVAQFYALYRRVLAACDIGKAPLPVALPPDGFVSLDAKAASST